MKKLLTYSFVMLFLTTAIVRARASATTAYAINSVSLSKQQEARLDKTALSKLCDSLTLEHDYNAIINVCTSFLPDSGYRETVIPYLIAARYFTGDSTQSRKMMLAEMDTQSYIAIIFSLIGNNVALIKYFDVAQNREPIIDLALKKYRTTANASRKVEGAQVIRFLINDQRIRKLKYAYKNESPEMLEQLNRRAKIADSIQNENIYRFYKKHGRYFSAQEVGENISSLQLIYFSHITDIQLRQSFFKPILEQAVKEGVLDKETLVNFILRTESFSDPEFWNTINSRLPEIRKKYDLPDSYIFNPF